MKYNIIYTDSRVLIESAEELSRLRLKSALSHAGYRTGTVELG